MFSIPHFSQAITYIRNFTWLIMNIYALYILLLLLFTYLKVLSNCRYLKHTRLTVFSIWLFMNIYMYILFLLYHVLQPTVAFSISFFFNQTTAYIQNIDITFYLTVHEYICHEVNFTSAYSYILFSIFPMLTSNLKFECKYGYFYLTDHEYIFYI